MLGWWMGSGMSPFEGPLPGKLPLWSVSESLPSRKLSPPTVCSSPALVTCHVLQVSEFVLSSFLDLAYGLANTPVCHRPRENGYDMASHPERWILMVPQIQRWSGVSGPPLAGLIAWPSPCLPQPGSAHRCQDKTGLCVRGPEWPPLRLGWRLLQPSCPSR